MGMFYWYFKIFNNIKSEDEVNELARLELESLFGEVKPIYNFADKLIEEPLRYFTDSAIRIQDFITHELPYGKIQGYFSATQDIKDVKNLIHRLAYIREIYLVIETTRPAEILLNEILPEGKIDKNVQYFSKDNYRLFRFITHQYFLEKSEYISKLSRNEREIDKNIEVLFSNLTRDIYRIPASISLNIGKRLQDYFANREEPSLYLSHYFHPYKGKFHPKMVRALLNYIYPEENGTILDNFAGSGTLLVEANLLGLDAIGVEINPLSSLMSNVKCQIFHYNLSDLKDYIESYIKILSEKIQRFSQNDNNLFGKEASYNAILNKAKNLSLEIKNTLRDRDRIIPQVLIARDVLSELSHNQFNDFLLLSLSGTISDVARRTSEEFIEVFRSRLNNLYLRIYLFKKMNEILKIKPGKSKTYTCDTRNMRQIIQNSVIDGIITSPPYAVALDYIKNDYPQLVLLELTDSLEKLEENMMGNPRVNYDRRELFKKMGAKDGNLSNYSKTGAEIVNHLISYNRQQAGLRSFKFFVDMVDALKEMHRVLNKNAKCAIIIGNNHYAVNNKYIEVPNDRVILEIAENIGFSIDRIIDRKLQKSSEGIIHEESILFLRK